jgi:predicted nucleotidyltransferase
MIGNSKKIKKIAKKYGLSLILLFGSQVTGQTHPDSDTDIAVLTENNLTTGKYLSLTTEFAEIGPEAEIDLVIINRADPLLLKKILENCRLLYGAPRRLAELKIHAFKKYCDYQRYFEYGATTGLFSKISRIHRQIY